MDADELRKLLDEATPGPWMVPDQKYRRNLTVEVDESDGVDRFIPCPGSGGSMSYTYDVCTLSWSGTDLWLANARLIALAPTLARKVIAAEKLVEALRNMADTDPDDGTDWFHDVAEKALAAWEAAQ